MKGIALGFLAYALFSGADASIKAIGDRLSPFEIGFVGSLCAAPLLPFLKPAALGWGQALRFRRPGLVLLRGLNSFGAGLFGIIAFTRLPFAEAYAILFLAPSFATVLSILVLKEDVHWVRWLSIALGLAGVALVVRPSFDTLECGHLAALAAALCAGLTVVILRTLAHTEPVVGVLAATILVSALLNGLLMLPDPRVPTAREAGLLLALGLFAGGAQFAVAVAMRHAPANRIAPAQYSQIAWALLVGSLVFGETPDATALVGLALIVLSGLLVFVARRPHLG